MARLREPLIVKRTEPVGYGKPGLHSHNKNRRARRRSASVLRPVQMLLFLVGLVALGYYCYTVADQYVYQVYQNWAFDQEIAGRRGIHFSDYVREQTPFGFLVGAKPAAPKLPVVPPQPPELARPAQGSLLGRVEIARLNLAAMVREGVDAKTLSIAVGHVPSTSLPGQAGNFAIAAHRDTLFRVLKDIRLGDLITFQSPAGTYTYQVVATKIVTPSDVSVLRSDGGGLIPAAELSSSDGQGEKLLTMITCYPFYYVGAAPKRFIVEARFVSTNPSSKFSVVALGQASSKHSRRG